MLQSKIEPTIDFRRDLSMHMIDSRTPVTELPVEVKISL
jgi:hypothetical protein